MSTSVLVALPFFSASRAASGMATRRATRMGTNKFNPRREIIFSSRSKTPLATCLDATVFTRKAIHRVIHQFFQWANLDFSRGVKMQPHPNFRRRVHKLSASRFATLHDALNPVDLHHSSPQLLTARHAWFAARQAHRKAGNRCSGGGGGIGKEWGSRWSPYH